MLILRLERETEASKQFQSECVGTLKNGSELLVDFLTSLRVS